MSYKKILGAIRRADVDFGLINDGDKICVGVSGGKDSVLLLKALHQYRHIARRYDNKEFTVLGIHLEMGFPGMDFSSVRAYMAENDIPYIDYPTRLYDILQLHPRRNGTIDCSLCSTLKKGAIVKAAKEYDCNKTAFAHHADDAVETLFMNMVHGARIATFTPAMHLSNTNMDFIRPLVYCFEDDISRSALQELQLPMVESTCPNDGHTERQEVKELLQNLYRKYPQARKNFLNSLANQEQLSLWCRGGDWHRTE